MPPLFIWRSRPARLALTGSEQELALRSAACFDWKHVNNDRSRKGIAPLKPGTILGAVHLTSYFEQAGKIGACGC